MGIRKNKIDSTDLTQEFLDFSILKENRKKQIKLSIKRALNNKLFVIGVTIVFIIFMIALFSAFLSPYNPFTMGVGENLAPLSIEHPMGTDQFGRDYMSRVFYGSRVSVQVGFIATAIATLFGLIIGSIAGYFGGGIDLFIMRIMDIVLTFPSLLLAIVFLVILGPSTTNAMISIGIVYIPITARVVRSAVLGNKGNEYVEAAKASGKSNLKILFIDLIPNCLSPLIIQAAVTFADAVVIEAGLSFLGLSAQIPEASWGKMLSDSMEYLTTNVNLTIFPGLGITILVLGFNLFGDGLRDILDPRLRKGKF